MRENRTYGSEGGGTETNRFSLPLSVFLHLPLALAMRSCWYETGKLFGTHSLALLPVRSRLQLRQVWARASRTEGHKGREGL
jgi:hypothetical protein